MFPARFDYARPSTLEEAVALLVADGPDAKVLAGGASLIPLMKLRLAEPSRLVDIGRLPGLDAIARRDGWLEVGALVRQADLASSPELARLPILADAVATIADPLVRNVGTIGGNVAHGDPANDHPAVLLALDARYVVHGPGGTREIPAGEFHEDLFVTALAADELLTHVRVPVQSPSSGSAYVKFERQVGDFAIAAAAAVIEARDGHVTSARVAFTNLAPTPVRSPSIERALVGMAATPDLAEAAAGAFDAREIDPWDDLRATARQKREMARAAARRAVDRAIARVMGAAHE